MYKDHQVLVVQMVIVVILEIVVKQAMEYEDILFNF
jgi:hypothetical protein